MMHMDGGAGIEYNETAAAALLSLAAEGGDRDAQYELALLFGTGRGVQQRHARR